MTMDNRVDIPGALPARDAAIKPLPVAPSIPILGSAREMLSDAPGFVLRTAREIGPIFRIPLGPRTLTLIAHRKTCSSCSRTTTKTSRAGTSPT